MKQIKVTYRAVFAQPIGALNPMSLKLPGPFPVEIFGSGERWQARELASPKREVYKKLGKFAGVDNARAVVGNSFAGVLQPWQTWGIIPAVAGQSTTIERLLEPDEIQVLPNGAVMLKEPDDYLHIIHAPTLRAGEKMPHAACGAKVKAESFINNKANVRPTCKGCAGVWEQFYQEKRA